MTLQLTEPHGQGSTVIDGQSLVLDIGDAKIN